MNKKVEQASNIPRDIVLPETQNSNNVNPLAISYNRFDVPQIMEKHCSISMINKKNR